MHVSPLVARTSHLKFVTGVLQGTGSTVCLCDSPVGCKVLTVQCNLFLSALLGLLAQLQDGLHFATHNSAEPRWLPKLSLSHPSPELSLCKAVIVQGCQQCVADCCEHKSASAQGPGLLQGLGLVHGDVKGANSKLDMAPDGSNMHVALLDLGSCVPEGQCEITLCFGHLCTSLQDVTLPCTAHECHLGFSCESGWSALRSWY